MIKNYFKVAVRNLLRNRFFSFINIMGLAVGMTACSLIFRYVRYETSYDSFHTKADRIYRVVVDVTTPTKKIRTYACSAPVAINLKKDFPEVEDAVRLVSEPLLVRRAEAKFQERRTLLADSTFFRIFDFPLIKGDRNTALREPMSVVLSESAVKKYFGDSNALGRHVLLTDNGIDATVTGVMKDIPGNSQIQTDMLVSLSSYEQIYDAPKQDTMWRWHNYLTYILMRPKASAGVLGKKLSAFMDFHDGAGERELKMLQTLSLEPLKDVYLRSDRGGMVTGNAYNVYIFSIIAVFILLIACINFINLTTARSATRAKEVGVRKTAGATRSQLSGQFLGESVIICWMAFALTLLLGSLLMPWFNHLAGKEISPGTFTKPTDVAGLFLLSTIIGMVAGIYPSLVLSSFKAVNALKGQISGVQGLLLRKGLVAFQFAVSIVLIVGTIVVLQQMSYLRNQDLGFSGHQQMVIEAHDDKDGDAFRQAISRIPGVLATTFSSALPGGEYGQRYATLENKAGDMQKTIINQFFVDFGFIRQYELKMMAGRAFSKSLGTDSANLIINESAVSLLGYSSPQEAIGKKYSIGERPGRIIGVCRNFNYTSLRENIQPMCLRVGWAHSMQKLSVKVTAANLAATIAAIEKNWNSIIPGKPFDYTFLDETFNAQYKSEGRFGNLFLNFAVLAIFISCLGVLGLASYSTLQRTKEIGVRKVLGASVANILRLLSADFIRLVLLAFFVAAPIGWYLMHKWLEGFAYRTSISWQVFVLSGGTALLVVMLSISYQAIKAAVANPVKSLRTE
jgi:putative ABC transport system permease protein